MYTISVNGLREALEALGQVSAAARQANTLRIRVGSAKPYAFGIETSRHRGGGLARRAGGAQMLSRGFAQTREAVGEILARGLLDGQLAGAAEKAGATIVAAVRPLTPVVSGSLRDSMTHEAVPGGMRGA